MSLSVRAIQGAHMVVIAYVILGPYLGLLDETTDRTVLENQFHFTLGDVLYITVTFGLLTHWFLNSDMCILTVMENKLRGRSIAADGGFIQRIVGPLYVIKDQHIKRLSYAVVFTNLAYLFFFKSRKALNAPT